MRTKWENREMLFRGNSENNLSIVSESSGLTDYLLMQTTSCNLEQTSELQQITFQINVRKGAFGHYVTFNPLSDDKSLDQSNLKAFSDNKIDKT